MFERLYLDTDPLRAAKWPKISLELSNLLALAKRVRVAVFLPVAVELELQAQYLRDYRELRQNAENKLRDHLSRVGVTTADGLGLMEEADLLATYRTAAETASRNADLQSVPLSNRPAAEYFERLLHREAPFSADGRGFGDAMIYLSVVDHLLAFPGEAGVIVTTDRHFAGVNRLGKPMAIELEAMALETAHSKMMDRLAELIGKEFATLYRELVLFLNSQSDGITEFIARRLEVPASSLGSGLFETVETLEGIESVRIERVATSPELWLPNIAPGMRLTLNITARLHLTVAATAWPRGPTRILKVGQPAIELRETEAEGRVRLTRTIERQVEIDAKVTRTADGYADLSLEGVNLKTVLPPLEALSRLVKQQG